MKSGSWASFQSALPMEARAGGEPDDDATAPTTGNPLTTPASEFSAAFVQGMQDRMAVSYCKYGPVRDAYPHKVNALESMQRRIDRYHETGNTEFLVDAANFLMIEFMCPAHPRAHFRGTDSNESPGRVAHDPAAHPQAANAELSDAAWRELHAG